jgi:hypothetical protein
MRALLRNPQGNRSFRIHGTSKVFAALRFVRLVVRAALGVKGFVFALERGRDSFAEMSRFGQKVIEVP